MNRSEFRKILKQKRRRTTLTNTCIINEANYNTWVNYYKELLFKLGQMSLHDVNFETNSFHNEHDEILNVLITLDEKKKKT